MLDETRPSVNLAVLPSVFADIALMRALDSETLSQVADHLLLGLKLDLSFLELSVVVSLTVLFVVRVLDDGLMGLRPAEVRHWRLRIARSVLNRCWSSIQRIVER